MCKHFSKWGMACESLQPARLLHFSGQLTDNARTQPIETAEIIADRSLDAQYEAGLKSEGDRTCHYGHTTVLPQTLGQVALIAGHTECHTGTYLSVVTHCAQISAPFLLSRGDCCLAATSLNLRCYRCLLLNGCHCGCCCL